MNQTRGLNGTGGQRPPFQTASAPQPVKIDAEAYYPETDVATLLGISADTLRRRRQTKSDLAFCKYGRRVFYRGADIIASLESSRRMSTSDTGPR
ncbi:MAG: helix-turn-helix domain-containing protein, partial [Hyphomicrobium sp.]